MVASEQEARPRKSLLALAGISALQGLTLLVAVARAKLGALALGREGLGVLGVLEAFVQIVAHLGSLGLPIAAVKFLSRAHGDGPAAFAAAYLRFRRAVLGSSGATAVLALAVVSLWPQALGPDLAPHRALVLLALLGAPLLPLRDLLTNALAAAHATRTAASLALLTGLAATAGALLGVLVYGGIPGFLGGSLAGSALVLLLTAVRLPSALRLPKGVAAARGLRPEVTTTALVLWACYASYPLSELVSRHVVLARSGPAEAGLLKASLDLSNIVALLLGPVTALSLAPAVNRADAPEVKGRRALAFLRELALAAALLALPLVLFSQGILRLVFTAAFGEAAPALLLLTVGQVLRVLAGVFHALLIGLDDVKAYGGLVAVAQLGYALLAWRLGGVLGAKGVALAFVAANAALLLLTGARLAFRHHVRPSPGTAFFVGGSVLLCAALGSVCGGVWQAAPPPIARLGLLVLCGAGLIAWSRGTTRQEEAA